MGSDVNIQKTVFKKENYFQLIDTSFKTYTQPIVEEDTDTTDELFWLYEKLYFVIDIEGEENSHEYLIKKSSELIKFDENTEDIQPLLDEIAQLREQLLLANEQVYALSTQIN